MKHDMKFLKNLQAVSEIMFFAFGFLFIIAFLFYRNNFLVYESEIFARFADMPFMLISIIFVLSSLRLSFNEQLAKEHELDAHELVEAPLLDAILIIFGLIVFLSIVFVNLTFPDLV